MDTSLKRRNNIGKYASRLFPVLLAMTAGSGMLHAANLLQTTTPSVTLTCNTATGPGASASVTVKPVTALTGSNTLAVGLSTPLAGGIVVSPTSATFTAANSAAGVVFSVSLAPGCAGVSTGAPTFRFTQGGSATLDLTVTVNSTLTATASGLAAPATVLITCVKSGSTYYPGGAQTVAVTSTATGGTPFTVDTVTSPVASWAVIAPTTGGTATSTAVNFTVTPAAGCGGFSTGSSNTTTIHLLNSPAPDKTIVVTLQVSAPSASSLVVSPSPITITCAKNGSTYTPSYPQTVSVTSPAVGGTAFTVDTVTSPAASWLSISSTTGGTATASPVTFTLQAASGCGGFALNSTTTTTVHLINVPANDKVFSVTLLIVPTTILAATPSPATLTYVKGSGTAGFVDVSITSTNNTSPFFSVNTATLPIWARLDSTTGVAPKSLRFSSTVVADTLAPGTYSASVLISVSGYGDLTVPISMLLTNKAPQLSIQGSTTVPLNWTIGQGLPTPTIIAISTDTPIAYTATTGGTLSPVISPTQVSGLAYSFGTPINVTFNQQVFAAAQPGNVLTGTVTLTWGSPASTIVVTFNITVLSPGATVSALSPASVPTGTAGTIYTVALTGTGFVPSTDSTQKTRVGIVGTPGAPMTFDTAIQANVINQSNITLTITVPNGVDANIPFAGGAFNIGVCNPVGGTCTVATGQATMTIGTNPIVQAVTSSSALLENNAVNVAPYDMISIFGANFCPGCTTNQVLTGSPDATTLTYPTALPFDGSHSLTVTFQTHVGASPLGSAPILFATNGQINLMVPSTVLAQIGNLVDIIVNYGSGSFGSPTLKSSTAFPVTVVATNPGIFTIGADGQGSGAALDVNYGLISLLNPAGIRTGSTNSDVISLYMTGLGAPDDANLASNATPSSGGGFAWSADCVTTSSYLTSFNAAQTGLPISTLDGTLIIPGVLNTGRLVPCISSAGTDVPSVTIGGVAATVSYAGWVPGTIAGLYQVNVQLPVNTSGAFTTAAGLTAQSITAPVQLPVTVTANNISSQAGVSIWVAPRLKVVGPSSGSGAGTVSATVGTVLPSTNNSVTATQGTGAMHYAVTSGLLPSGLTIDALSGLISGTPAAGTAGIYTVTVTATDSANVPVTGTATFVVTVAGGLFMTNSTPTVSTFGSVNGAVSSVTATSGVFPYVYSIAINGHSLPSGLAINPATGVISTTAATPAGSYLVVVSAHDSTTGTPLVGTATFTIVVNLNVASTVTGTFAAGVTTGAYNTLTTTGNTGTVTYALDAGTAALSWITFDTSTGILSVTASSVASTRTVTITATDGTAPGSASAAGTGSTTFALTITP